LRQQQLVLKQHGFMPGLVYIPGHRLSTEHSLSKCFIRLWNLTRLLLTAMPSQNQTVENAVTSM
jgi:hypothetical protein